MIKMVTVVISVVVYRWVGKEFPDVRQNERRKEFVKVGDAIRIVGQLKESQPLSWTSIQILYFK